MDLGLLLASLSPRTRRISSRSPFILFIRVPIFTHSPRALYLLNISLPVSNHSSSSVHDFLLSFTPSTPRCFLRCRPVRSVTYRRRDGPSRDLYTTGTHSSRLARRGNLVGVDYHLTFLPTLFASHHANPLQDFLPLKVFHPWLFDPSPWFIHHLIRSLPNSR